MIPTIPQPGFNPRSSLDKDIPVVAICNISETFYEFLSRASDPVARDHIIRGEQYRGDRTLLWLGDPKLAIVSFPIPHAEYLYHTLGYRGTSYVAPAEPSYWLSLDILREPALMEHLVSYAGAERAIQLIPYATTSQFLQLAEALQVQHGLNVLLPESPAPDRLWLRDYFDTKAGFRILSSHWLPDADSILPQGMVCQNLGIAAQAAHWFCASRQACVVKADIGENGIGNIIGLDHCISPEEILERLQSNPFLGDNWITVERFIHSSTLLSPSLEVFVPPLGAGDPEVTYLSNQLFQEFGDFCGVLVDKKLVEDTWYPRLAENGMIIAMALQKMGYIGHFDLDAIVDDEGNVFLVEANPRRTGGTHVHEFAHYVFGSDYLDKVVLLSNDSMDSGAITDCDTLLKVIDDLLFPMQGEQRGVIIAVTSALEAHEFGGIIVASSTEEALSLQQTLIQRVCDASV